MKNMERCRICWKPKARCSCQSYSPYIMNWLLYTSDQERLEDDIIARLREFSKNDFHNYTTGFQRMFAQSIIDKVIKFKF